MTPVMRTCWLGSEPYPVTLARQEALLAARRAGAADDTLLLVEHEPVVTVGCGEPEPVVPRVPGPGGCEVPVYRVRRGGGATFHGPGQLVIYPIVDLRQRGWRVRDYLCRLERALMDVAAACGVRGAAHDPLAGVWAQGCKLASIGIGVRAGITIHGAAINVTTDLRYFDVITACRQPGVRATSLAELTGVRRTVSDVANRFVQAFEALAGHPWSVGSHPDRGAEDQFVTAT